MELIFGEDGDAVRHVLQCSKQPAIDGSCGFCNIKGTRCYDKKCTYYLTFVRHTLPYTHDVDQDGVRYKLRRIFYDISTRVKTNARVTLAKDIVDIAENSVPNPLFTSPDIFDSVERGLTIRNKKRKREECTFKQVNSHNVHIVHNLYT